MSNDQDKTPNADTVNLKADSSEESEPALAPDLEAALREAEAHAQHLKTDVVDVVDLSDIERERTGKDESAVTSDGPTEPSEDVTTGAELEALRVELAQAKKQQEELKQSSLRARADLENARRRFEREKKEDQLYAGERVLKALVPIVDDLDRALDSIPADSEEAESLTEGVKMVHRKFLQALESQGAKSFYPLNETFDPTTHEALMETPNAELEPGTIAQVFQRGWMLNERLLRPAKVIIAKAP